MERYNGECGLVKERFAVALGNGKSTLFWDHCWATDHPLRNLAIQAIPMDIDGATVEEMWNVGQGWKWDTFANLLPNNALKQIASHKLVEDQEAGDLRYWKGSKTGGFSIRYAMQLMREEDPILKHPKWELAWKTPVQQRVRTFLWLILHNRLLCNANLMKRQILEDPRCKRCNLNEDETLLHLLRDCPTARHIWQSVGKSVNYPSFYSGNLEEWMIKNLQAEGLIHSDKWPSTFAITLWWNWRWRNLLTFGRAQDIPVDVGSFLAKKVEENERALNSNTLNIMAPNISRGLRREIFIRWIAPPMDWVALNTDGAAKGSPGEAGGGGILRDNRGNFLRGFSANLGTCTAYKAELLAAEKGLEMALEVGVQKLILQMDNKACIESLLNPDYHGGECFHILNNCRRIINSFGCNFNSFHCFREGNRVADRLANIGVGLRESVVYFDTPPPSISLLLWEDIVGVASARLVP